MVASGFPKFETLDPPHPNPLPAGARGRAGRVMINADQHFDGVPEIAWGFHIGGYQPAQKWLKDRRRRSLSFDDITHYQRIVKILVETDRIMKEIELPLA
ncbi:MAG: type ISP restriction/modification enzyme [Sphingomicrobium sp.]